MANMLGYMGLLLNLSSMAMKEVLYLRILSLCANMIYMLYGLLLQATPFIIGCTIAVGIHIYHIHKILKLKRQSSQPNTIMK